MAGSESDGKEPGEAKQEALKALQSVLQKVFVEGKDPNWSEIQAHGAAIDSLRKLSDGPNKFSPEGHAKFQRALVHVIAGMITILAVILAAIIGSLGSVVSAEISQSALSYRVFGDLIAWIAIVFLLGASAAIIIQGFRFLTRGLPKRCCWWLSGGAVAVVLVLVFVPSYFATKKAICGGGAFGITNPPRFDANGNRPEITGSELRAEIPDWIQWSVSGCTDEAEKWFPLPYKKPTE